MGCWCCLITAVLINVIIIMAWVPSTSPVAEGASREGSGSKTRVPCRGTNIIIREVQSPRHSGPCWVFLELWANSAGVPLASQCPIIHLHLHFDDEEATPVQTQAVTSLPRSSRTIYDWDGWLWETTFYSSLGLSNLASATKLTQLHFLEVWFSSKLEAMDCEPCKCNWWRVTAEPL